MDPMTVGLGLIALYFIANAMSTKNTLASPAANVTSKAAPTGQQTYPAGGFRWPGTINPLLKPTQTPQQQQQQATGKGGSGGSIPSGGSSSGSSISSKPQVSNNPLADDYNQLLGDFLSSGKGNIVSPDGNTITVGGGSRNFPVDVNGNTSDPTAPILTSTDTGLGFALGEAIAGSSLGNTVTLAPPAGSAVDDNVQASYNAFEDPSSPFYDPATVGASYYEGTPIDSSMAGAPPTFDFGTSDFIGTGSGDMMQGSTDVNAYAGGGSFDDFGFYGSEF